MQPHELMAGSLLIASVLAAHRRDGRRGVAAMIGAAASRSWPMRSGEHEREHHAAVARSSGWPSERQQTGRRSRPIWWSITRRSHRQVQRRTTPQP